MSVEASDAVPAAETLLNCVSEVVTEYADRTGDDSWSDLDTKWSQVDGVETGVRRLTMINCHQWDLENQSRARYSDSEGLSSVKRQIDASNARRTAQIDELNRAFHQLLVRTKGSELSGTPALITPAEAVDRLSILVLRRHHLQQRDFQLATVDLTKAQISDLVCAFDDLIADVLAGRRRVNHYGTTKLYE